MKNKNILNNFQEKKENLKNKLNDFINSKKDKVKNIIWASVLSAWMLTWAANAAPTVTWVETNYNYPHISLSIDHVWIEKVREFMQVLNIQKWDDSRFASEVLAFQKDYWITEDWILWEETYNAFKTLLNSSSKKIETNISNKNVSNKNISENLDISKNVETTKKLIWDNEFYNFLDYFKIRGEKEFVQKVIEIQKANGLEADWIIGSGTLGILYKKYYNWNLPFETKYRKEIYNDLNDYPNKWYKLTWLYNVAKEKDYFYGLNSWENFKDTFLNQKLYSNLKKLDIDYSFNNWNSIQIGETFDNRHFIALLEKWEISVLSYVIPGRTTWKSPQNTVEDIDFLQKYYVSGSYPKNKNWKNWWAVMPYAIEVDSSTGIYIHARKFDELWTRWCFWVPVFYQKWLYDKLGKNWIWKYKIKIWNLY